MSKHDIGARFIPRGMNFSRSSVIFSGLVGVDITEPASVATNWNISEKFIVLTTIIIRMMNLAPKFCDIFGDGGGGYHRTGGPWRLGTAPRRRPRRRRKHKEMNIKSTNKRTIDYIRRLRHTTTGKACYFVPTKLDRPRCWRIDPPLIRSIPGYAPPPRAWRVGTGDSSLALPIADDGGDVAGTRGSDKPKDSTQKV